MVIGNDTSEISLKQVIVHFSHETLLVFHLSSCNLCSDSVSCVTHVLKVSNLTSPQIEQKTIHHDHFHCPTLS